MSRRDVFARIADHVPFRLTVARKREMSEMSDGDRGSETGSSRWIVVLDHARSLSAFLPKLSYSPYDPRALEITTNTENSVGFSIRFCYHDYAQAY